MTVATIPRVVFRAIPRHTWMRILGDVLSCIGGIHKLGIQAGWCRYIMYKIFVVHSAYVMQ